MQKFWILQVDILQNANTIFYLTNRLRNIKYKRIGNGKAVILLKKAISRKELEKLYQENSNQKVAEILGVSDRTVTTMIERAGLKLKGKGNRNKNFSIEII